MNDHTSLLAVSFWEHIYHIKHLCLYTTVGMVSESLDHLLILEEKQLQRVLNAYVVYFNQARPHQGIAQQVPERLRPVPSSQGAGNEVVALPVMYGLHHDYQWAA